MHNFSCSSLQSLNLPTQSFPPQKSTVAFFKIHVLCSWPLVYICFEFKTVSQFPTLKANNISYYLVFHFHVLECHNQSQHQNHPTHQPQPPNPTSRAPNLPLRKKMSPAAGKRRSLLCIQNSKGLTHRSQRSKIFRRKWNYLCNTVLQIGSNFILFFLEDFIENRSAFTVLPQQKQTRILILKGRRGTPVLWGRALIRHAGSATGCTHKRDLSVSNTAVLSEASRDASEVKKGAELQQWIDQTVQHSFWDRRWLRSSDGKKSQKHEADFIQLRRWH